MNTLILNTGSSSLKWSVLHTETEGTTAHGETSWADSDPKRHATEIEAALASIPSIEAAGHRVVHGGLLFREAALITDEVRADIANLSELAPLHNPAALAGIDAVKRLWPALPQIAAFDTAFHATIPESAALYPLPHDWTTRWNLRRYGFHGLSNVYALRRTAELLGAVPPRIVVCHLGSGCSVTAIAYGQSVDTSMGFTPLDGVMMATRSGAVDPGLLFYLMQHQKLAASELDVALNTQSGIRGVSETSGDFQTLLKAMPNDPRARLAYEMFAHSITRMTGAMVGVLGGLDVLIFTGGIGEHAAELRADITASLGFTGLALDRAANDDRKEDTDVASRLSTVRVLVITAREDLAVLSDVRRLLHV